MLTQVRLPTLNGREVTFTIEQARRALPYVAQIVSDASQAFRTVQLCMTQLQQPMDPQRRLRLEADREEALQRLNAAIDDCNAVGADLLDLNRGAVRFNATLRGNPVSLLWNLGDATENAWADLTDDGPQQPAPAPEQSRRSRAPRACAHERLQAKPIAR